MAFEVFSIFTLWWQNISLLLRQKVELPSLFDWLRQYLVSILSLQLNGIPLVEYLSDVRDYTRVDYRIQYIVLNIILPLIATFMTMLLFRSFYIIIWYFTVLVGISLIFASIVGFVLPRSTFSSAISNIEIFGSYVSAEVVTLVLGCFFLFVCFLMALVFVFFKSVSVLIREYKRRKRIETNIPEHLKSNGTPSEDDDVSVELKQLDNRFDSKLSGEGILDSSANKSDSQRDSIEMADALRLKTHSLSATNKKRSSIIDTSVNLRVKSSLSSREDSFSSLGSTGSEPSASGTEFFDSSKKVSCNEGEKASSTLTINVRPNITSSTSLDEIENAKLEFADTSPIVPTYDMLPETKRRSVFSEIVVHIIKGDQTYSAAKMERHKKKALKIRPLTVVRNFSISLVLLLLGLFMVQVLKVAYFGASDSNAWDNAMTSSTWGMVCIVVGSILMALSILFCTLGCLNCWKPGRRLSYLLINAVKINMLKVLFLLIAIVYTPIITSLFSAFVCENATCPTGQRHSVRYNTLSLNTLFRSNESAACVTCSWHENNECPTALSNQICPEVTDSRLFIDPTLSCFGDIAYFFWLPSILLGIAFAIGLPLLYCSLTRLSVKYFKQFDVDILKKKNLPLEILKPRKAKKLEKQRKLEEQEKLKEPPLANSTVTDTLSNKPARDGELSSYSFLEDEKGTKTLNQYRNSKGESVQSTSAQETKNSDSEEPLVIEDVEGDGFENDHPDSNVPRYLSELRNLKRRKTFQESVRNFSKSLSPATIKKSFLSSKKMEEWRIRTAMSKNPIRSLYYHYEYRTNQFALFNLIYKLLVVIVSVTLVFYPIASVGICIILHGINAGIILLLRPYILFGEDLFAGLVGWLSLINAIYVFIAIFVEFGNWSFWALLALNTIIPICVVVLACTHLYRGITSSFAFSRRLKKIEEVCEDIEDDREGIKQLRMFIKEDLRRKYNVNYRPTHRHDYGYVHMYLKKLRRQHKDVDLNLSNVSLKRVLAFFLFLGVCCFIGLISSTIGVLYGELNPVAVSPALKAGLLDTCTERTGMEFVGYHNWANFTQHCCCAQATNYMNSLFESQYTQVEMWTCMNGFQKERVREVQSGDELKSGLAIRGFCNSTFETGYQVNGCVIDGEKKAIMELSVPSGSTVLSYALDWLW